MFIGSGYKVLTVYLTGKDSPEARLGSASDEVIFLDYSSRAVRGLKIGAIQALRRIAATREFSMVIAHRFKPIYIACLATPLPVIGVHHAFGDYDRPQRRWFVHLFRRRLALLAVSNAVRDQIRTRLPSWPHDRIECLHNRLDVEKAIREVLPRQEARTILGLPQDAIVIGNVGRLHPDKDQATLIAGFAAALPHLPPDTLLAIIGSGPLERALERQAHKLGIANSVRFLGQIPEARRKFRAFDIFVLSSDHEPFGMVLLEAMAAGIPIIATDCGGAPEILDRQDSLFGVGDTRRLSDLIIDLVKDINTPHSVEIVMRSTRRLRNFFSDDAARKNLISLSLMKLLKT